MSRICLILLIYFVSISKCAVFQDTNKIEPGQPVVCKPRDVQLTIKPGESAKHPTECLEYRCTRGRNENELLITGVTCIKTVVPSNCKLEYPIQDKYPECCHSKMICS